MRESWLQREETLLKQNWAGSSRGQLQAFFPNRSWNSLERKAQALGLKRRTERFLWNDGELSKLIYLWANGHPREEIEKALPGRSWTAIKNKANLLQINRLKIEHPILVGQKVKADIMVKGNKFKFALVSDTHFGSKYAQITYLHQFYDLCKKEGVETILHPGDLSEGNGRHYPGQLFEMHITGADNLKSFIVKHYPKFGGKTRVIAGYHDLDLWTHEGYDLLEKIGGSPPYKIKDRIVGEREDIKYLGQASVMLDLAGVKFCIMHPSGGTAYAISYRLQKIVEGFASENKPQILVVGHFHKAVYIPLLRNVYAFYPGCFQAQTPFALRKNLYWQYGGWIIEMGIKNGITNMKGEFIPFYKPIPNDYQNFERR